MNLTRIFIHGLESSSKGTKGVFFRETYPGMIVEDYPGSLEKRMEKLNRLLTGRNDIILAGSSFGGLMAAIYACENEDRVRKVILLAPALHLEDFHPYLGKRLNMPAVVFHGTRDEVVPLSLVRRITENIFKNITYNVVDDDHPLRETFLSYDWDNLLMA
ncbi:MAG: alpha/beta fold hydrolase [Deltaproteobacteria bacterium]|nr:alpha/beta fold hydrolase [Deltaproteobacteria bacterium]